jgi:DNA (cytosine-5)-methyltransferase 1
MKYLSVCSGIEAATVAWHPLGWEAIAYSEIEKFPSEVLAHHYPSTPNVGDMTKFKEWNFESNVDLLVGGTPCQSFSVAGLRKGLDDPRGNLMLTYLAIAKQHRPNWLVWENVPGVLSSNGGLDFASLFRGMGELGYGFAYRILDAQYFGVAQRRRRVFVVGYLGDWRPAAAVLFERHSLQGHPAPRREKRKTIAPSLGTGAANSSPNRIEESIIVNALCAADTKGAGNQYVSDNKCVIHPSYGIPGNWIGRKPENGGNATEPMFDIAPCLTKADQHGVAQPISYDMRQHHNPQPSNTVQLTTKNCIGVRGDTPLIQPMAYNIAPGKGALKDDIHVTNADATKTLDASGSNPAMHQGGAAIVQAVVAPTLTAANDPSRSPQSSEVTQQVYSVYQSSMAVRRLTPVECERLQGFPDNYTNIKQKCPDGPRYKALGNSMAVPVMAWIGARIQQYEDMQ